MTRLKIVVVPEELETCKKLLMDMAALDKGTSEYATKIGLRRLPYDLNSGLEYLQLMYKQELRERINLCPLECAIVGKGVNHLLKNNILNEWTNTREYLMKHPDIKLRERFRASANEMYSKEYLSPYYVESKRNHYLDIPTANRLGHLAADKKINIYYLYPIAHLYGQIYYMNALTEIPNQKVYESIEAELFLFEEQIEEELDFQKIRYKLYSIQNETKILTKIINTPELNNWGNLTPDLVNCGQITPITPPGNRRSLVYYTIIDNETNTDTLRPDCCGLCGNPLNGNSEDSGFLNFNKIHPSCKFVPVMIEALTDIPAFDCIDNITRIFKKGEVKPIPAINALMLIHKKNAIKVNDNNK